MKHLSTLIVRLGAVVISMALLLSACAPGGTELPIQDEPAAPPQDAPGAPTQESGVTSLAPGADSPTPTLPQQPGGAEPGAEAGKVAQSQVLRDLSPQVDAAQVASLAAEQRAFALDFYQAVRGQDGNLFFSPYSLSTALAMTYAGAAGSTAAQMKDVLHFNLPDEQLHPAFNALDLQVTQAPAGGESQPFQLRVANSLWGQQDYPFLAEFLDKLALNYGAGMRLVDFKTAAEPSRQEINKWISQQTEDRIQDLIPEGAIGDLTRLVLANAIYFKADWLHPFSMEATQDSPFNMLNGSQVSVPFMSFGSTPVSLPYAAGDGYQAVELPYVGESTSMVLIVPEAGRFADFEAGLDAAQVDAILGQLQPSSVSLALPKFEFSSNFSLADVFKSLGMADAFTPGTANFSGMDGTQDLSISGVFHKAFVAVDEKGTEAAAASAVVAGITSIMEPDVRLVVDRPFLFLIRHQQSGAILFLGRLVDPAQ